MSTNKQSMSRRSPSILVTDARYGSHKTAPFVRGGFARDRLGVQKSKNDNSGRYSQNSSSSSSNNQQNRFENINITNILSDVSEIPSAQRRHPTLHQSIQQQSHSQQQRNASTSPSNPSRTRSSNTPTNTKTTNTNSIKKGPKNESSTSRLPPRLTPTMMQGRTTKQSEKLVLIPEEGKPNFKFDDDDDIDDNAPPRSRSREPDDMSGRRRSYAERLPKDRRTDQFGRVTAYCVSDAIRLKATAEYLREKHKIRPRIYDEALFAPYYLPLLPGDDEGSRVKSSPQGLANMERLINESERGDHHYEYFSGLDESSDFVQPVEVHDRHDGWTPENEEFDPSEPQNFSPPEREWVGDESESAIVDDEEERVENGHFVGGRGGGGKSENVNSNKREDDQDRIDTEFENFNREYEEAIEHPSSPPLNPKEEEINEIVKQDENVKRPGPPPNEKHAEMFIFTYGIVVFWNFTERQEKDVLADLTFARIGGGGGSTATDSSSSQKPLVVRPIDDQDIETEELHFIYSPETNRPRIYNDMITLKSGDHMIKLAMSHAVAQSTKLSRFEARMDVNMHDVKHVPKMLALTGKLGLKREEVLKISGKLFKLRVDVNLSSNVLDTPEFFWEDEPSLNPLYTAVREYLEIEQRILVLNERAKVFLELTDIIADSIAEGNMSRITWIIIILIALSLGVSTLEIFIRYTILGGRE